MRLLLKKDFYFCIENHVIQVKIILKILDARKSRNLGWITRVGSERLSLLEGFEALRLEGKLCDNFAVFWLSKTDH